MKKFLIGLKDLILRHKLLSMICILAFTAIMIMLYVFFSIFVSTNNVYGRRLNGIEKVKIAKSELNKKSDKIEKNDEVKSAKVRIQGKIVYFDIIFKKETSKDKAKEIANKTLDEFSKEEKEFYDFEYVLASEDSAGFKITGTSGPKTEGISFIKS
ncbi:MAG: hypothetical protein IKF19_03070 [Bacilli bacterium]|nr:hypothetical protein [Bacilli bacterium]